jgi:hypothetical protein
VTRVGGMKNISVILRFNNRMCKPVLIFQTLILSTCVQKLTFLKNSVSNSFFRVRLLFPVGTTINLILMTKRRADFLCIYQLVKGIPG